MGWLGSPSLSRCFELARRSMGVMSPYSSNRFCVSTQMETFS
jgi:hypothetical protein